MKGAIDNSNMLGYNKNLDYTGFDPKQDYVYDANAQTVTVTDDATVPAAAGVVKEVIVAVHDKFGNTKEDNIAAAGGNTGAMDVSGLDASEGLTITATVTTTKGWTANGSAKNIGAAGSLGAWNKGESAAEALNA